MTDKDADFLHFDLEMAEKKVWSYSIGVLGEYINSVA